MLVGIACVVHLPCCACGMACSVSAKNGPGALLSCTLVQVLEALASTHSQVTAAEVYKVKDRFRAQHLCDRVLAACAEAQKAA
jgi:hypothetical protein